VIHRLIASLALGLIALGCGKGAEEPAPRATTGSETRPAPEPMEQQAAPQAAATPVSDDEISQFAQVYQRLLLLEQRGATRVEGGEEAEAVARELAPEVQEIFTSTGLTPERFDEIARAADADDALRARIEARLGQPS
jgi:hypothetical protein